MNGSFRSPSTVTASQARTHSAPPAGARAVIGAQSATCARSATAQPAGGRPPASPERWFRARICMGGAVRRVSTSTATTDPTSDPGDTVMAQVLISRLEAAIAELRERPIPGTEKGFGVPAPGAAVSATSLGASRPSLFGPGFTMPVLVLREPAVAHNIGAMAAYCAAAGVKLAPHGKTTMAPQLFARQLAAGAWAITAATVGELQVYRAFGVPRALLANELTDPAGAAWLAGELAADPGFDCYVYADSLPGVRLLDEAVRQASPARPLPVLVELGYPGGRTGCRDLAAAEAVARAVAGSGSLRLAGAAGYEGLIGHDRSPQTIGKVTAYCRELRSLGELLAAAGLTPDEMILSAGGSAFFDIVVRELASGWAGQAAPKVVLRSGVYIAFDHGDRK